MTTSVFSYMDADKRGEGDLCGPPVWFRTNGHSGGEN